MQFLSKSSGSNRLKNTFKVCLLQFLSKAQEAIQNAFVDLINFILKRKEKRLYICFFFTASLIVRLRGKKKYWKTGHRILATVSVYLSKTILILKIILQHKMKTHHHHIDSFTYSTSQPNNNKWRTTQPQRISCSTSFSDYLIPKIPWCSIVSYLYQEIHLHCQNHFPIKLKFNTCFL